MTGDQLRLAVMVAELLAKLLPGAIQIGANLIDAIRSNGDLSDEQKADLVARVTATRAAVAAYEPRPHAGSPSVGAPEPKPTAPG